MNASILNLILQSDLKSDKETCEGHASVSYAPAMDAILGTWMQPADVSKLGAKKLTKLVRHARWIASDGLARNARGGSILDSAIGMTAVICALTSQPRVSFADAHALGGGSQEGAAQINGVSRARLHKVAPGLIKRAAGTLSAQYSRTVGKNSIFLHLGITQNGDAHGFSVVSRNHPLIVMTADVLNRLSETTIVEILGGEGQ